MCSAGVDGFCSVSEKREARPLAASYGRHGTCSQVKSIVCCINGIWRATSTARAPDRGRFWALARSRTSRSPAPAPHILATTHGTWHTSGSEGRERSHANHMGESRGTSTNVHRPRVASRRPALPASLSVLRLRALLSINSLTCSHLVPGEWPGGGRRGRRARALPHSAGS
jgi:hypothetical protein